jgi:glycosyltransferase involved in cell wall biosynthesis
MKRFIFLEKVSSKFKEMYPDSEMIVMKNIDQKELVYYYNCLNFFLLASDYEGMPNVIKESLICGIPFISTNVSDLEKFDCVLNDHCHVVERNEKAFLKAMVKLRESNLTLERRKQLRNEGKKLFSLDKYLAEMKRIYFEL